MFVDANVIVLVVDTEYLHGTWLFSCDIEVGGYCGFLICDRISGEVDNDVCVREWACVWVEVLIPINIRGYKYSDCIWIYVYGVRICGS